MRCFFIYSIVSIAVSACFEADRESGSVRAARSSSAEEAARNQNETENQTEPSADSNPKPQQGCVRPPNVTTDPETIEGFVSFVNAMPKPLSVACLIQALPRPLNIHITSKSVSGQPTSGTTSPRIFFFLGPSLVMTVVPAGFGARKIELGFRIGNLESVKGEIEFPVTTDLPLEAPYLTILAETRNGTICAACHNGEQNAGNVSPIAFGSRILVPDRTLRMSLAELEAKNAACLIEKTDECPAIEAIFSQGQVIEREFL